MLLEIMYQHERAERKYFHHTFSMNVNYDSTRFEVHEDFAQQQFSDIYKDRIEQLRSSIVPRLQDPYCEHLNQMVTGKNCSIVGVLYKNLAERKSILDDYKEIGFDSQNQEEVLAKSDKDTLFIEDSTGRIEVVGLNVAEFTTGIVVGLYGTPDAAKFISLGEPVFPVLPPPKEISLPTEKRIVYFVSELAINCQDLKEFHMKLSKRLNGADLIVFLGNNFDVIEQADADAMISFNERLKSIKPFPVAKLESFFKTTKANKIILMPGFNDPCTTALPQQPYHRVLINSPNVIRATNPALIDIDGFSILLDSGESPQDVSGTTLYSFPDSQRLLLNWAHIAPTAPDHLTCVPVRERDLLVMESSPHAFVCGLAPLFATSENGKTDIISVPSFKKEHSIVAYDLSTRHAEEIKL